MCGAMMDGMMDGMPMWGPGWMMVAGLLSAVVLLGAAAAAALVVASVVRRPALPSGSASRAGDSNAVLVAKDRYARGEIDDAELERVLDTLLRGEEPGRGRAR